MTTALRYLARAAAAAVFLLGLFHDNPARAGHGLEELKAEYTKQCDNAKAVVVLFGSILLQIRSISNTLEEIEREQEIQRAYWRSLGPEYRPPKPYKEKEADALYKQSSVLHKHAQKMIPVVKKAQADCHQAQQVYSQALTQAALTKWLEGPSAEALEAAAEEALRAAGEQPAKKKAKKKKVTKKKTTTRKTTTRKQPKPKHSANVSAAVGIAVIGIIGGYVDGKSKRKKSSRTPSRRRSGGSRKRCPRGDC